MDRVLVIAEPGCTHEGRKADIERLIRVAAAAGCDVFKNQWTSYPEAMLVRRHIPRDHPKHAYYRTAYGWINYPFAWHAEFAEQCKALGMAYACSVYLPQDAKRVAPHVSLLKVSSFEAPDKAMWRASVMTRRPWVLSTGLVTARKRWWLRVAPHAWVEWIWRVLRVRPLHCVSAYPAPLSSLNLRAMARLHGFSDHSRDLLTGAVAVGAGARILETHFRLYECDPENPDYKVAFDPGELAHYVLNIRKAEQMMGDGVKRIQECEKDMLRFKVTA